MRILANQHRDRLGIISFYIEGIHYNLIVKLLNDLYGIQTRGGCACAGTYGHYLLEMSYEKSLEITDRIDHGDLSVKPGWVRWSIHPTTTNEEVELMVEALNNIVTNIGVYSADYIYDPHQNLFINKNEISGDFQIEEWLKLS